MADIYLHSILAESVIKELDYDFNKNLVFLGAQGPDPMYYKVSGKNSSNFRYYADRMHDTDTQNLFIHMLEAVKLNNTQETYSHLIGFICHYALDVKIHPYVYHNVGVYKKEDPNTHQYRGLHLKFERSIDAVMIQKELNIKPNKLKLHKTYFPTNKAPLAVMEVMNHVLDKAYNVKHGGVMYLMGTVEMYRNVKRLIYDRFGIKKQFLKLANLFYKGDMHLTDLSFYNHIENYDYLNESKKTWYHPITNEPSNKTVHEMFEDAKTFALELIKYTDRYLKGEEIDLKKVFTNLSFNSGIDCKDPRDMQYFNNYRK